MSAGRGLSRRLPLPGGRAAGGGRGYSWRLPLVPEVELPAEVVAAAEVVEVAGCLP